MEWKTLDGAVVVLTGGTSGIGRVAAERFGELGAEVVLVGRDRNRGVATLEAVREKGGDGLFVRADLGRLDAVRGVAEAVEERYDGVDVLALNAALSLPEREVTEVPGGRVERVLLVNHLAPYLLTHELVGHLESTPPSRVVVTASGVHTRGELRLDDPTYTEEYDALGAYARSKLANVLFSTELAERLPAGVDALAYHPGFVPGTSLYRETGGAFGLAVRVASLLGVGRSVEQAGLDLVYAAGAPELADASGGYLVGRDLEAPDSRVGNDTLRERLWDESARLLDLDPDWL
ncbi:SDR family NAD(P)-dependent oxidoreductase [Halomarina oriensis]|uniref:SDR family NAD(P)-dependent oxidoreductase n=1 Tax=Halomarina oriensis TaxID=671145 RepID=A0A6B0GJP4_9EURY|nr:SDR family NAD(P)-dependent oxidoreductase [Halomarina oriensis]MWG34057.1 SDR family NAD(P)-dependent oxidoreductase [Halomarina oriensis]